MTIKIENLTIVLDEESKTIFSNKLPAVKDITSVDSSKSITVKQFLADIDHQKGVKVQTLSATKAALVPFANMQLERALIQAFASGTLPWWVSQTICKYAMATLEAGISETPKPASQDEPICSPVDVNHVWTFQEFADKILADTWLKKHKRGRYIRSMIEGKLLAGRGDYPAMPEIRSMQQFGHISHITVRKLLKKLDAYAYGVM